MMRRCVLAAIAALCLMAAMPAWAAYQDAITVSAYDSGAYDLFEPSFIELRRGGTVTFEFDGPSAHTATDGSGLDLYDSGVVFTGGSDEVYTYVAAGTYDVVCTLHAAMDATVYVPVGVTPSVAARGDTLTVTWASQVSAGSLVYDVQWRKPGGTWRTWRDDATVRKGVVEVNRVGTWRFRARLERASTGLTSDWSRVATAAVG